MAKHLPIIALLAGAALLLPLSSGAQNDALGIVTVPLANVRKAPEPKSPILTQVLLGDIVRVLEKRDHKYRISISGQQGIEGWVQQEALLIPKDNGDGWLAPDRPRVMVTAPKARSLILDKLGNHTVTLYAGTRLPIVKEEGPNVTVRFPDRSLAVLDRDDVRKERPWNPLADPVSPGAVARTARGFIGARHLSGGLTAQGIDTSGLVNIVYRVHGVTLGRDAADIAKTAARVAKKDLEPGDILVFSGEGLGLMLDQNQFLRSDGRHQIQLAGIHDKRFANSLRHGLRIIGADPAYRKRLSDMTADEVLVTQAYAGELPLPQRIAYWAGRLIGTPYDPDPLGLYVRTNRIVADEAADCMYHTFRSVELAMTTTPSDAVAKALDLRFITGGKERDGLVQNYDDRFQYGEDMVWSGKWGRNVTPDLGATRTIAGSRGKETVDILSRDTLQTKALRGKLRDGDIVYWVKDPKKRVVGEIVAHLSIVHIRGGKPHLIHAAGSKNSATKPGGGVVKEVPFEDYVRDMTFIGAFVTRFEP